ncbi:MAG: FHA domain-containing protein [Agarilytica sp.]
MAYIKSLNSQALIYLKPVHIFGRDPNSADYVLNSDSCSRMHCVVRWQNGLWMLTDESRNGCFINGKRIEKGRAINLNKGDIVSFTSDGNEQWQLENEQKPSPVLISDDNSDFIELQALNILPNERAAEYQILKQGEEWMIESGDDSRLIEDGFRFQMSGKSWSFHANELVQETTFYENVEAKPPKLTFNVSRNEEHVQLIFDCDGKIFDLGHKTHHYLLLEMARHSQQDNAATQTELGWMSNDLLLHNLRIDLNHLNIQIFRAREAIRKCSRNWGQRIIDRRRGEIRLHPCELEINQ